MAEGTRQSSGQNGLTRRRLLRAGGVAVGVTAAGTIGAAAALRWNQSDTPSQHGKGTSENGASPSPDADGWQAAIDSRDYAVIEEWYAKNTGHEALGIDEHDLTPGSLVSEHDGQTIEGIRGDHIRIAHNNVTIRGCRIEGGALHGAYFAPTHGADITGTVVEYCTYDGGLSDVRANYWSATNADAVVTRYCNIFGWRSGHTSNGGATFEYCWVHDLSPANDTHRTGMQISGADCHYRRNYITDGGSACAAAYFDVSPMHNSSMEENILNGSSPNASPSYLINLKSGEHGPPVTNFKLIGNVLGREHQFGPMSDVNVPWGERGNENHGNSWFDTDELVGEV